MTSLSMLGLGLLGLLGAVPRRFGSSSFRAELSLIQILLSRLITLMFSFSDVKVSLFVANKFGEPLVEFILVWVT